MRISLITGLNNALAKEQVDAPGELVTTRGALQIPNAPTPEVYVAALGPQMLRVAGRRTAGTITWMTGPKTLREHVGPTLRGAAADAGRAEGSVAVAAALPISVTDDVAKVRSVAAEQFVMYGHLPSYRAMLDREGFSGPEDAALIGDEATVSHQLDELRDAGVDEFVGIPFDPSAEGGQRTRACLRAWGSRERAYCCGSGDRRYQHSHEPREYRESAIGGFSFALSPALSPRKFTQGGNAPDFRKAPIRETSRYVFATGVSVNEVQPLVRDLVRVRGGSTPLAPYGR
jgi:hypothetical protein